MSSVVLLAAGLFLLIAAPASAAVARAIEISLDGVVDPLAARYVERSLRDAQADGAAAVIIRIDTPGGLDSSMRAIIQDINDSEVPVVCWVGPSGARAASAGAIIMLGCPHATMAPGTNVGAAHPVGLTGEILAEKITNDAAAYARALAQERNRDAGIAERMVRESISLSAEEALARRIIDAIAIDQAEALDASGVADGATLTLTQAKMTFMEMLLHDAIDPNLAFLLLIVGLLGIVSEFLHPGITVGGVVGGLSLIGALVILGMLPVNLAGLLLVFTGIALMVAEMYLPGGIAGATGLIVLVLGGLFLFDASIPDAQISKGFLIAVVVVVIAYFLLVVRAVLRTRRTMLAPASTDDLVGTIGIVERRLDLHGVVRAGSESWSARSVAGSIPEGAQVVITKVDGLTLEVEPAGESISSNVDA